MTTVTFTVLRHHYRRRHCHYYHKFFPFLFVFSKNIVKKNEVIKLLYDFKFLRDPIPTVTLKTDCMYVLRSLQTNYMPFVTMFLSWSTVRWILARTKCPPIFSEFMPMLWAN